MGKNNWQLKPISQIFFLDNDISYPCQLVQKTLSVEIDVIKYCFTGTNQNRVKRVKPDVPLCCGLTTRSLTTL